MADRAYLILGGLMLGWFGYARWTGYEYTGAQRALPAPGQVVAAATWFRSSSARYPGSSGSGSGSSRSGIGIFGGK